MNFLLTDWLAKKHNTNPALRIDDEDQRRYRREYAEEIFRVLEWLNIEWTIGPKNVDDLEANFSFRHAQAKLQSALRTLAENGLELFVCSCSRQELDSQGYCISNCRRSMQCLAPGDNAMRVHVPRDTEILLSGVRHSLTAGDPVLWTRDNQPSYHLVNIVSDAELGTTHIVRGADLVESSLLHIFLSAGLPNSRVIEYLHHGLVTDRSGRKLSKSHGTARLMLTESLRERVRQRALDLGAGLGLFG